MREFLIQVPHKIIICQHQVAMVLHVHESKSKELEEGIEKERMRMKVNVKTCRDTHWLVMISKRNFA